VRRRPLFFTIAVLTYMIHASMWAQETGQPVASPDGKYIKEWLVLGPFFPGDINEDLLTNAEGEANANPGEGDTITTTDGRILIWKRYTAKGNIIDLLDAVGQHDNAIAYAFCVLDGDVATDAQIYC
jgi:hypothetical protein